MWHSSQVVKHPLNENGFAWGEGMLKCCETLTSLKVHTHVTFEEIVMWRDRQVDVMPGPSSQLDCWSLRAHLVYCSLWILFEPLLSTAMLFPAVFFTSQTDIKQGFYREICCMGNSLCGWPALLVADHLSHLLPVVLCVVTMDCQFGQHPVVQKHPMPLAPKALYALFIHYPCNKAHG